MSKFKGRDLHLTWSFGFFPGLIALVLGSVLSFGATHTLLVEQRLSEDRQQTEGRVTFATELDSANSCSTAVHVEYPINERKKRTFSQHVPCDLMRPKAGQVIYVEYSSSEPRIERVSGTGPNWLSTTAIPALLSAGVALFAMFAVGRFAIARFHRFFIRRTGRKIWAIVLSHEPDETISFYDNDFDRPRTDHAWRIVAEWTDPHTGKSHRFVSEPYKGKPSWVIGPGRTVEVIVDPHDFSRYTMEVGVLADPI